MVAIHQFNPEIYPYKLWIVITSEEFAVKERFNNGLNEELKLNISGRCAKAITFQAVKKETLERGVMIIFTDKKYIGISEISHESTHAASFMWDMMGEKDIGEIGEEANAYLVGWIAGCCEAVKKYKKSKDGQTNDTLD